MQTLQQLDREWQQGIAGSPYGQRAAIPGARIEYWDQEAEEYDLRMDQDDRRIRDVLQGLAQRDMLFPTAQVLDVGCGTGCYSLALAQKAQDVLALDLSEQMGKRLCKKAEQQEVKNLEFMQADWDTLDLEAKKLVNRFDLVMSGLNPGINSLEALQKLCRVSRRGCCLVTFDGPAKNKTRQELARLLYQKEPRQMASGYNVQWPLRLLQGMGFCPEQERTYMAWTKTHGEEAAVRRLSAEYAPALKQRPELVLTLKSYVRQHLDADGMFREHNEVPLGIIYWRVDE